MNTNLSQSLLKPITVGDLTLSNRITMASLTRLRADPQTGVPNELHIEYYSQRASAGLILSEAAPISKSALGLLGAAGLYTTEQVQGWKKVTEAVHSKGGKIFAQLWHMGRAAHAEYSGEQPIAPSPIRIRGTGSGLPYEEPREMSKEDIKKVTGEYRRAALNAKEAGFDGVELHGANGYLIDEFIRDGTNKRSDEYGGSPENRVRFPLEVVDVLVEVWGKGRVGIKLSPVGRFQDMYDSDPVATYGYLLRQLEKRGIAYVQIAESDGSPGTHYEAGNKQLPEVCKALRPYFNGLIIINNNLTPESAVQAFEEGVADLVSFGKYFISNPDFVNRIKNGWDYAKWDFGTFYGGKEKGYTDYALHAESKAI